MCSQCCGVELESPEKVANPGSLEKPAREEKEGKRANKN